MYPGIRYEEIWIVYRDVEDFPRKQFEILPPPQPGQVVVKPTILPGAFGYPDMHISVRVGMSGDASTVINLITYTEHKLTEPEVSDLIGRAFEFANDRN